MIQIRRRTTAAALAIFVALATLATASLFMLTRPAGAQFSDTPPWAAAQINWLAANGIAEGYPDGSFRPNLNITRAQAAYWFGNYNNAITMERSPAPATSSTVFTHTATCPAGKRAIGGGGSISATEAYLTDSWPSPDNVPNPTGWVVRWETENNASVSASLTVWALCAPQLIT